MSRIVISKLNPLHFVRVDPPMLEQYRSRHMDDIWLAERLQDGQHFPMGQQYFQPWQNSDVITLQALNNMGPISVVVMNCRGGRELIVPMTTRRQDTYQPNLFIYESNTALTDFDEGKYWILLEIGIGPLRMYVSEPIEIKEEHEGTLLAQYVHREHREDYIFETGITPSVRFHGRLNKKPTASKDTLYEDQVMDMVMVQSIPYRLWDLTIGPVPDWFEEILSYVIGCSGLRMDGRYYTKNAEAKLEEVEKLGYGALGIYNVEVRDAFKRSSLVDDSDASEQEEMVLMLNTTSKGFGDTSETASSSITTFSDIE